MHYFAAGAQHIGARHYQQDAIGFAGIGDHRFQEHAGFLAILCDGMGGLEHGEVASEMGLKSIQEAYAQKLPAESIPGALERSLRHANDLVYRAAQELGVAENMGTTAIAAALCGDSLYFASAGDSGLFHFDGRELRSLNRPHVYSNVLQRAVASGLISEGDAARHPERGALTSFLGIRELTELDLSTDPIQVRAGEAVILASDGLFNTLTHDEIAKCLRDSDPASWAQALVDRTIAKCSSIQDNVSVVVMLAEERNPEVAPVPANSRTALLVGLVLVALVFLVYWTVRQA